MILKSFRAITSGFLFCLLIQAQSHPVDPRNSYYRIITVVPLTGTGTYADPKRPMYTPSISGPAPRNGIIAFTQLPTDDKRFAIVEFVAADRSAFKSILADKGLKVFEKTKHLKNAIELELKIVRKDFSLDNFGAPVR